MRGFALLLSISLMLLAPRPGLAGSRSGKLARQARKHTKVGLQHVEKGRMDRAIESFQIAYGLDPQPVLLFYIAEAHNSKKEYPQALYHYRQYREKDPRGAKKRKIDQLIDALSGLVEEESAPPPPTEEPEAAQPPAEPPAPDGALMAPSMDEPAATPPLAASTDAGDRVTVTAAPSDDRDSGRAGRGKRVVGLAAVGAGAVLLAGAGYYAKKARDRSDEISELFESGDPWDESNDARYDEGRSARTRALVLAGAGGAALVTGVVLYVMGWRDRARAEERVEVVAAPRSNGVDLVARWAF